jgi:hypothetical protein
MTEPEPTELEMAAAHLRLRAKSLRDTAHWRPWSGEEDETEWRRARDEVDDQARQLEAVADWLQHTARKRALSGT